MTSMWRDIDTHDDDSARGLVIGFAIGAAMWFVMALVVAVWLVTR